MIVGDELCPACEGNLPLGLYALWVKWSNEEGRKKVHVWRSNFTCREATDIHDGSLTPRTLPGDICVLHVRGNTLERKKECVQGKTHTKCVKLEHTLTLELGGLRTQMRGHLCSAQLGAYVGATYMW